jgi:hypothetical protein
VTKVTAVPLAFKVPLVPLVPLVLKAQSGAPFRAYLESKVQRVPLAFKVQQHGVPMALLVLLVLGKELLAQQEQQGHPVQQRWQWVLLVLLVTQGLLVLLEPGKGYVATPVLPVLLVCQLLALEPKEQQGQPAKLEFRVLLGHKGGNRPQYQQQ